MHKRLFWLLLLVLTVTTQTAVSSPSPNHTHYLPISPHDLPPEIPMVELRGVWVSRFDWTTLEETPNPAKLNEIVDNIDAAGFNVIFFQVRAAADAYYTPGLEPWATRLTGTLGQNPGWDPLAHLLARAHAKGIQVHAYLNVYPVTEGCQTMPGETVTPTPLYHRLRQAHGSTDGLPNGLQWHQDGTLVCDAYLRATPASAFFNDHLIAVATDLVQRYDIDGLHLDHIRYGAEGASCDPVSEAAFGRDCFAEPNYASWQRAQINQLVARFYNEVVPLRDDLWLSAAVWPLHTLNPAWGWPGFPQEGNVLFHQDSKAWLANGTIHSISPMIYPGGEYQCPDNSYYDFGKWETLVTDFQAARNGRFVFPGIGTDYCTFDEIEQRIRLARQLNTGGHALFSYHGLAVHGYFDDLAAGPYRRTAVLPLRSAP